MVAVTFTVGYKMVAFPAKGKYLTDHATAMYWAYLFSQLGKIIFPVGKKIFLGIKKAHGVKPRRNSRHR